MSQWIRRSSSLRPGGRPSQDQAGGPAHRFVDRNSRIPLGLARSSSHVTVAHKPETGIPTYKRSKSTLGPFTPQEKLASTGSKVTPQAIQFTPKFYASYSSKKPGHQKDTRNLQDKEFQKEAAYLVLSYFQNVQTMKVTEIRPMTIKLFIEMVNHLLAKLGIYNKDEMVQFTTLNYVKELPHWIGNLDYPGSISKGWLQTVNVPQCWPNVIGLLSWLVSLVQVTSLYDCEEQLHQGTDKDQDRLFKATYLKGCLAVHNCEQDGGQAFHDICQEVVEFSEQIHGLTDDVLQQLHAENNKLREKAEDAELKAEQDILDELEQRLNVAQSQSMKAIDDLEAKTESIENIKLNLAKKERNIHTLKSEIEAIRQEAEALKEKVGNQSMSVNEFAEIKKKCDYLLKEISYTEKECEDNEKLVSRYEHDIATKRDKILQNASMFNRQVIQLEQQVPELQGLRARTNPESTDVVDEVEKLARALNDVKTRLTADCEELEVLRREKQQRVDNLKQRFRDAASSELTVRERVLTKKSEIEQLRSEVTEKEKQLKLEVAELEKRQMVYQQKQQENENQIKQIQEMETRLEFLEKCRLKILDLEKAQWDKLEQKAKYFHEEIRALKRKIETNEGEIEGLIDQLMTEFHKK